MDRASVKHVLRSAFGNIMMRDQEKWVSIRCPLARWRHERGSDSTPSAGVSVHDSSHSIFNCYTCKSRMPLTSLLRTVGEYTGDDYSDLIDEIGDDEELGAGIPAWERRTNEYGDEVDTAAEPLDEGIYMDLYDSAAGHPYLKERGISDATAKKLELLFDPKDPADGHPRILFPVRGVNGELYGFSGRDVSGKAKLKVRDYHGLKKAHMILGAHLHADAESGLLVEGLFDYAKMVEYGYMGLAVMHSGMTEQQAAILREIGKPLYLVYDNDKAGDAGVVTAKKLLEAHLPLLDVYYPEVWIENEKEEGGGHWLKDPGEMLREEVDEMIREAVLY